MTAKITYYRYLKAGELGKILLPRKAASGRSRELLTHYFGSPVILLNSGRTGIYLCLAAYGLKRNDEILVPRYLSQCVLNTINRTAFPATQESEHTKAILILHQFGYPQQVEDITNYAQKKGWLIIEDCAHSLASTYRGKNVGLFGDAAIFSFPKIFPTILGGCLVTGNDRILNFTRAYLKKRRGFCRALLANLSVAVMFMVSDVWSEKVRARLMPLLDMCYSQFVECPSPNLSVSRLLLLSLLELESSIAQRIKNLDIFKEYFLGNGYWDELETGCRVVPWAVPYFAEDERRLTKVVETLRGINVETEILHFDIQRNMFHPDYRKCIPIPVHQGITDGMMHNMCKSIVNAVKQ